MLWDLYWNMIDKYGYDPNWNNKESGNFKAVFLVMEGMKMQTCNPGFIAGRNASMRTDTVHFSGANGKILWETFARRGLGYYANGGSSTNRNDGIEDFEVLPTLIEKLKIDKTATPSVNPVKDISITIDAINHIPSRQNNVIITDELEPGMTYVSGSSTLKEPIIEGNLIKFEIGNMEYKQKASFSYKVNKRTSNRSMLLQEESFDGEINWEFSSDVGSETWFSNFDIFKRPVFCFWVFNVFSYSDFSLPLWSPTWVGTRPAPTGVNQFVFDPQKLTAYSES